MFAKVRGIAADSLPCIDAGTSDDAMEVAGPAPSRPGGIARAMFEIRVSNVTMAIISSIKELKKDGGQVDVWWRE